MQTIGHVARIFRCCPRCGSTTLRSLRVCGRDRTQHVCLRCGHRHASVHVEEAAGYKRTDKLASLRAFALDDRDRVETLILVMLGSGTLVGQVETTGHTLHELKALHGEPTSAMPGFAFPVFSWLVDQAGRHASHLVVIDQGA
ncbi:hypothetical protein [Lysobacter sp.]|uniref:hypothetical protein n=1 Tax=Lysobacter sp. TaxID=72226 RepID=UPI002D49B192|nr:hypothetical protein [Lysobacter sp.]HZX76681.1 hypothetical protein [Lysobacter sp.]